MYTISHFLVNAYISNFYLYIYTQEIYVISNKSKFLIILESKYILVRKKSVKPLWMTA